jgi:hypothetical protein
VDIVKKNEKIKPHYHSSQIKKNMKKAGIVEHTRALREIDLSQGHRTCTKISK